MSFAPPFNCRANDTPLWRICHADMHMVEIAVVGRGAKRGALNVNFASECYRIAASARNEAVPTAGLFAGDRT
jgi:hypothetical protein